MYIKWKEVVEKYLADLSPEEREAAEARMETLVDEILKSQEIFKNLGSTRSTLTDDDPPGMLEPNS